MITLTLPDGTPCAVNPMQVFSISRINDLHGVNCVIWSPAGHRLEVKETFQEVEKRLKAWAKG